MTTIRFQLNGTLRLAELPTNKISHAIDAVVAEFPNAQILSAVKR